METTSGSATGPLTALAPGRRRRFAELTGRESLTGLIFVAPWLVGFLAFSAIPMAASLVLSLTDFDPRQADEIRFVGLDNYIGMFSDPAFIKASHPYFIPDAELDAAMQEVWTQFLQA